MSCHSAACSGHQVTVAPSAGEVFPGPEGAGQGAPERVEETQEVLVLRVGWYPALVAQVDGDVGGREGGCDNGQGGRDA